MNPISRWLGRVMLRAMKEGPWSVSGDGTTSWFGFETDPSGVSVTERTSLQSTAVWACVRILAETVASCPLYLYERSEKGGRRRAEDHPVFDLFAVAPNDRMTPMLYQQAIVANVAGWGNHYSWIERDGSGNVVSLTPLNPDKVTVEFKNRSGSQIIYKHEPTEGYERVPKMLDSFDVFHVSGLAHDGLKGISVVGANKDAIGLDIAQRRFGAKFFSNGSRPGGVLKHKEIIKDKQARQRLKEDWESMFQGERGWHRVAVLDGGLEFQPLSINPDDAQYVEQMQFSLEQIARMFGVPLVLLQSPEKGASYGAGIEQLMIGFTTYTLRPYMVRIEQEAKRKLLRREERKILFFEHLQDALLRGDIKTRYEAHTQARNWGFASINDVRRRENMDPIDEVWADDYIVPVNMAPARLLGQQVQPANPAAPVDPAASKSAREVLQSLLAQHLEQLVARQVSEVRKSLAEMDAAKFLGWTDSRHENLPGLAMSFLGPTLEGIASELDETEPRAWAESWCKRYANGSKAAILGAIRASVDRNLDRRTMIETLMDQWTERRAREVASVVFAKETNHEHAA